MTRPGVTPGCSHTCRRVREGSSGYRWRVEAVRRGEGQRVWRQEEGRMPLRSLVAISLGAFHQARILMGAARGGGGGGGAGRKGEDLKRRDPPSTMRSRDEEWRLGACSPSPPMPSTMPSLSPPLESSCSMPSLLIEAPLDVEGFVLSPCGHPLHVYPSATAKKTWGERERGYRRKERERERAREVWQVSHIFFLFCLTTRMTRGCHINKYHYQFYHRVK